MLTEANGLLYMRARYYSPDMMRFINEDIVTGDISNSNSLNRYSYVEGNPITMVDPFGLEAEKAWYQKAWDWGKEKTETIFDSTKKFFYNNREEIREVIHITEFVVAGAGIIAAGLLLAGPTGGTSVYAAADGVCFLCGAGEAAIEIVGVCELAGEIEIALGIADVAVFSMGSSSPTSRNQMQQQVEKGQAPKEVDRVDPAHIDGQQPHIHFGEGEAALNQDGTWHDAGNKKPRITKKLIDWLIDNMWEIPNE